MDKKDRERWILLEGFFVGLWESKEWFWLIKPFSKLKESLCKYRTSIKMKISMTCVYKDYGVKTKMVQEQWIQLKTTFLLDYNLNIVIQLGKLIFVGGREETFGGDGGEGSLLGGIFPGGGMSKFLASEGTPPARKTLSIIVLLCSRYLQYWRIYFWYSLENW